MEQLISDLKRKGLVDIDSIVDRIRRANLINGECAAKVRKLLQDGQLSSSTFDVTQLNQILETISGEGNIPVDVLISEITSTTTLSNNKSEVIAAFYSWKKSPLARIFSLNPARPKPPSEQPVIKESVSAYQVEKIPERSSGHNSKGSSRSHSRSSSRSHSKSASRNDSGSDSRSASTLDSCCKFRSDSKNDPQSKSKSRSDSKSKLKRKPMRQASPEASEAEDFEYSCHGGYCETASEETMSECDVPKYPELDTELPTQEALAKKNKERIEQIRKNHEREKNDALSSIERMHHNPPIDRYAMEQKGTTKSIKGSFSSVSYNASISEDDYTSN